MGFIYFKAMGSMAKIMPEVISASGKYELVEKIHLAVNASRPLAISKNDIVVDLSRNVVALRKIGSVEFKPLHVIGQVQSDILKLSDIDLRNLLLKSSIATVKSLHNDKIVGEPDYPDERFELSPVTCDGGTTILNRIKFVFETVDDGLRILKKVSCKCLDEILECFYMLYPPIARKTMCENVYNRKVIDLVCGKYKNIRFIEAPFCSMMRSRYPAIIFTLKEPKDNVDFDILGEYRECAILVAACNSIFKSTVKKEDY